MFPTLTLRHKTLSTKARAIKSRKPNIISKNHLARQMTTAAKPPKSTLDPSAFFKILAEHSVGFYSGVPDSLLKDFCAFVTSNVAQTNHVITANEGCAVALAAGHYMASGNVPLVYLQNSGLGNIVNPIMSLAHPKVYGIPVLLLIGWRGEPNVDDEPQHVAQGQVTPAMLDSMSIPWNVLPDNADHAAGIVKTLLNKATTQRTPVALLVKKETFSPYKLSISASSGSSSSSSSSKPSTPAFVPPGLTASSVLMSREEAIEEILRQIPSNGAVVGSTGFPSREIFEIREKLGQTHSHDFLTVGSMGHVSSIALGISLASPQRPVFSIEGDGSLLMHMGTMVTTGQRASKKLKHIILNNGVHDSVGAQPSGMDKVDIPALAIGSNYKSASTVHTREQLKNSLGEFIAKDGPSLLEVKCKSGARKNLGRPTKTTQEAREEFMKFLSEKL